MEWPIHENLIRINAVCHALEGLQLDYVFVGGATVSLYATDSSLATEIRPTDDVDVTVGVILHWIQSLRPIF